jgi:hypothetical protein
MNAQIFREVEVGNNNFADTKLCVHEIVYSVGKTENNDQGRAVLCRCSSNLRAKNGEMTDKYDEISECSLKISDYNRKCCVENGESFDGSALEKKGASSFGNVEPSGVTRAFMFL